MLGELFERNLARRRYQNTCPECGATIIQVGEDDVTCVNCGAIVHFQGTTAYTDRMLEEMLDEGRYPS